MPPAGGRQYAKRRLEVAEESNEDVLGYASFASSTSSPLPPPSPRAAESTFHQLRVELLGSRPSIWRCLCVPSYFSLYRLHCVLQAAFEWRDEHGHVFKRCKEMHRNMAEDDVGRPYRTANCMGSREGASCPQSELDKLHEERVQLSEALPSRSSCLWYEYDFEYVPSVRQGCQWNHRIVVEHIRPMSVSAHPHQPYLLNMAETGAHEECYDIRSYNQLLQLYNEGKGYQVSDEYQPWLEQRARWEKRWGGMASTVKEVQYGVQGLQFIYQLHIALDDSKPSIWRRVDVPALFSLHKLHFIIQALFEWRDQHTHIFRSDTRRMRLAFAGLGTLDPDDRVLGVENEEEVTLSEMAPTPKSSFAYFYSTTDLWRHTVTVEKIQPRKFLSHRRYPQLMGGANCGPPEDSGGIAFYKMMARVKDKRWMAAVKEELGHEMDERRFKRGELQKRMKTTEFTDRMEERSQVKWPAGAHSTSSSGSGGGEHNEAEVDEASND